MSTENDQVTLHATLLKDAVEKELKWFDPDEPLEGGDYEHARELIAPRAMESLRTRMEHVFTRIYVQGVKDGYVQGVERESEASAKIATSAERERARTLKYGTILSDAQKNRLNKNAPPFVPDSEGDAPGPGWFTGDWPAKAFAYQEREGTLLLQFTAETEEEVSAEGGVTCTSAQEFMQHRAIEALQNVSTRCTWLRKQIRTLTRKVIEDDLASISRDALEASEQCALPV